MVEFVDVKGKVGEIKLSDTSTIVVSVSEWKNKTRLDIRKYVNTDTYKGPTKGGVSIPIEKVKELDDIINTVVQNLAGLITSE